MKHSRITSLKQVIVGYHLWMPIKPERKAIKQKRVYCRIGQLESFQKLYIMSHIKDLAKVDLPLTISMLLPIFTFQIYFVLFTENIY